MRLCCVTLEGAMRPLKLLSLLPHTAPHLEKLKHGLSDHAEILFSLNKPQVKKVLDGIHTSILWFPPHAVLFLYFVVFPPLGSAFLQSFVELKPFSNWKRLILKLKKGCFAFEKG